MGDARERQSTRGPPHRAREFRLPLHHDKYALLVLSRRSRVFLFFVFFFILLSFINSLTPLVSDFNRERFLLAVLMNGQARICLEDAWAYAMDRQTFGKPLMAHQSIRHKLVAMARYVESHWAWLEQIAYHAQQADGGRMGAELASRIALAKVHGGRLLELVNREAQQVFGGAAYQRGGVGARVEQIGRDLRVNIVGGGSEEIISDLAVRQEIGAAVGRGAKL